MKTFSDTPYCNGYSKAEIKFVELMFGLSSELNKERNFDARLSKAKELSGMEGDVLKDARMRVLIHNYLSEYLFNPKFQLLMVCLVNYWNVCKLLLEDFEEDEDISKRDKATDYASRLQARCEHLFGEIFSDGSIIDIAKEQIRTAVSPEQRLKRNMKANP